MPTLRPDLLSANGLETYKQRHEGPRHVGLAQTHEGDPVRVQAVPPEVEETPGIPHVCQGAVADPPRQGEPVLPGLAPSRKDVDRSRGAVCSLHQPAPHSRALSPSTEKSRDRVRLVRSSLSRTVPSTLWRRNADTIAAAILAACTWKGAPSSHRSRMVVSHDLEPSLSESQA